MNEVLGELRPRMMSVAFPILGNVADAEDAVQDAFLNLLAADGVTSPEGFLVKATTHRCIDQLRAKRLRERHVRPGASDFVEACRPDRPEAIAESLGRAFRFMLERLTPGEMAAFLLRTAFNYEYLEIADILDKTKDHARQILCRANARLRHSRPRFKPASQDVDRLAERFVGACRSENVFAIEDLLVEERDLTLLSR